MPGKFSSERLTRRKVVEFGDTALPRVLTLLDLTALGIGSTVGVGFYVLAGEVARNKAGPAVIISFLIAGVASLLAGICFAEFGGRVPKAGSAYIYTYVCIGEFVAFIIGWNLILEYVIGTASVASGFSGYIDSFANNAISKALEEAMPMDVSFLGDYPNFVAFGLCAVVATMLALGVKESSLANNIVTIINMFVIVFVIIASSTLINPDYWHLSVDDLNLTCPALTQSEIDDGHTSWGTGGFAPYGFEGIMAGAAACFYGFVGFDVIASTGEEAKRPERNLPLSIFIALTVIFLSYFGMSSTLTLAEPYCKLDAGAPLIALYEDFDMNVAAWIVRVGSVFGFSASLFGAIFPLPRIIYAMASDGLLFRSLGIINSRFQTPLYATVVSGSFAAIMALLFDIDDLIDMMSIGTLQAYSIVALCVMMLRYTDDRTPPQRLTEYSLLRYSVDPLSDEGKASPLDTYSFSSYIAQLTNKEKLKRPNKLSSSLVAWLTLIHLFFNFLTALLLVLLLDLLTAGNVGAIVGVVLTAVLAIVSAVFIAMQPRSDTKLSFMVPLVPLVPVLSVFINMYLMCNLSASTWIKFVVWMAVGLAIYFIYSVWYDPPPILPDGLSLSDFETGVDNKALEVEKEPPPEILVVPATPLQSAKNTPHNTVSKSEGEVSRRSSKEVVISPLVTAEIAEKAKQAEEKQQMEVQRAADASDVLMTAALVDIADDIATSTKSLDEQEALERLNDATDRASLKSMSNEDLAKAASLTIDISAANRESSLESVASAPVLENRHPKLTATNSMDSALTKSRSDDVISGSVPATPLAKRRIHPHKVLKRGSSFEFIPPRSPDDPGAKRMSSFTVIPVREPSQSESSQEEEVVLEPIRERGESKTYTQQDINEIEQEGEPKKTIPGEPKTKPYFDLGSNVDDGDAKSRVEDKAVKSPDVDESPAAPDTKSAVADTKSAVADTKSAVADTKSAVADTKSAVADTKSASPDTKPTDSVPKSADSVPKSADSDTKSSTPLSAEALLNDLNNNSASNSDNVADTPVAQNRTSVSDLISKFQ